MRAGGKGGNRIKTAGWHHWLNGYDFEQTLGDSEGQRSLVCCSPWGRRVRHNLVIEQQLPTILLPQDFPLAYFFFLFMSQVSHIVGGFFTVWATREAQSNIRWGHNLKSECWRYPPTDHVSTRGTITVGDGCEIHCICISDEQVKWLRVKFLYWNESEYLCSFTTSFPHS